MPGQKIQKAESQKKRADFSKKYRNQDQITRIVLEFKTAWEKAFSPIMENSVKRKNRGKLYPKEEKKEKRRKKGRKMYELSMCCAQQHPR